MIKLIILKICERWNSGGIRNYLDDHKTKEEMINLKCSSGNVAATHYEKPSGGGIFHLMGCLFLASVHKTPDTEVADYRDSTPYSGEEYSGAPIEIMYG